MDRFLGIKPEEMLENQKLWREENTEPDQFMAEPSDLRNIGITPGGIESDMNNFIGPGMEGEEGETPELGPNEVPGAGNAGPGANVPVAGQGAAPAGSST